jgi:AraC-like DNA-binding protein
MRFPKARLTPLLRAVDDSYMRRIPRGTQVLRLLDRYAAMAWDERTVASADLLQRLMSAHVFDLMAVMIGANRDAEQGAHGGGLHAARLHALKQDIARNLDQPDLSVAALATRHACTPRFIQRLFEAAGTTFTDYVLVQRMARAHGRLIDPGRGSDKISTVAYDCGFSDVSYFNRVFRRHYGAAPSDIRARARRDGPDGRPS